MSDNQPIDRVGDERGLSVAIFKNTTDEGKVYYSTDGIESRYYDKKEQTWKSTKRLSERDWPVAALLLEEATRRVWKLRAESRAAANQDARPAAEAG